MAFLTGRGRNLLPLKTHMPYTLSVRAGGQFAARSSGKSSRFYASSSRYAPASRTSRWGPRALGFFGGLGLFYAAGRAAYENPDLAAELPMDLGSYLIAGYAALPTQAQVASWPSVLSSASTAILNNQVSPTPTAESTARSGFEEVYQSIPEYVRPQRAVVSPILPSGAYLTIHLDDKADLVECAILAARSLEQIDDKAYVALGFSERVWSAVQQRLPAGVPLHPYTFSTLEGSGGSMPATGGDIYLHFKADDKGSCMDAARVVLEAFPEGSIFDAEDLYGFKYRDNRDLTGFRIDHDSASDASPEMIQMRRDIACEPTTGGSYMLAQVWRHKLFEFMDLSTEEQEGVYGRTKESFRYVGSVDLGKHPDKLAHAIDSGLPEESHIARVIGVDQGGNRLRIFPQSLPTGTWAPGPVHKENTHEPGLCFLAYTQDPVVFSYMCRRMVGAPVRADQESTADSKERPSDALLKYSRCIRSQLYYAPSAQQLKALAALS
mmetsp:Transcript_22461/g.44124  ORF Transcript_22461/g.44124 Transcript_22461/m.44124 type:complete len:494 (-) Transcript_22461:155-1636(-)|eukprot:CAMPEP_0171493060 /NCGR_PEP_ID=MMETSP0958-20121227/4758_1 /TAXON_ID=87120 /ORGANISM="Aurantiochytrium limacinum, Strain ATCCMYA-1381" /LENGTH=493 /DNA_ID=CAMNT_0012026653 /DNA_START=109 /DNA_END=1590 /DNA_ORIENTATION=+